MAFQGVISETAYAKVNLALHVRSRRSDGYHELDTIFAFVDSGDQVHVQENDKLSLIITGPFADDLTTRSDNLALQAAMLLQSHYKIDDGASLHLEKCLPIASGIGGGSADAAAAARILNRFWKIDANENELAALLAPLGADIPACVSSRMAHGQGTGTDLVEILPNPMSGHSILLVNPLQPVSTAAVFTAWDGKDKGPLEGHDVMEMIRSGRNDLQDAALELCPDIDTILHSMHKFSPQLSRMSGSGATCFALFSTEQECDAAQNYFQSEHTGFWTMVGKIR
jgi:4-diphosphocytidyl-2-C-methyl-D-erythritol kinase